MLRALLLASSLLLVCLPTKADNVYVWRDADGVVNYSDSPPVGGDFERVRKLHIPTYTPAESRSSVRPLTQTSNTAGKSQSVASQRGGGGWPSLVGGSSSSGGTSGGGIASAGASRPGGSSFSGGGRDGGSAPLSGGNSSASGSATAASGGTGEAVPISTAAAPDRAVPISTATAPDRSVPISTAAAPDQAVPISTPTSTASATTAPSGVSATSGDTSGSSTWSQIAGGTGSNAQATLYWDMVKAPNIEKIPHAGFRVYFGTASGSYLQPFGQGVDVGKVTSYTVQGLTPGTRYYFAVTTQVGGHESRYSNEAFKDIPSAN